MLCLKGSIIFDKSPFKLGKKYTAPGLVANNGRGLAASIGNFHFQGGATVFNFAQIVFPPLPFGSKQVLRLNNTTLYFDLPQGTRKAQVEYLEHGGLINLNAGAGGGMYIGPLYRVPAQGIFPLRLNGVTITRTSVTEFFNHPLKPKIKIAEKGRLTFTHPTDIGGLVIGGQELFLDTFCFN